MRRVGLRAVVVAIAALVLGYGRPAVAEPRRKVALVSPGTELEAAARAALQPWDVELLVLGEQSPGPTAPDGNEKAHALAQAYAADAVVWISEHAGGHALWVYDLDTDHVIARELGGAPPFDGPTAAAVALSVKTLLRHSATAPEAERYGAEAAAPRAEAAQEGAAQPAASRSSAALDDRDRAQPSADASGLPPSRIEIAVSGGARFGLTRPRAVEPRFALGAGYWPSAGAFGLLVRGAFGPGIALAEPHFEGRFVDATIGAAGQLRVAPWQPLRLVGAAGVAAHVTSLDGAAAEDDLPVDALRVVPALELELRLQYALTRWLAAGVRGGLSLMLRPQRYLVRSEPVLELARTAFEAGLELAVALPD